MLSVIASAMVALFAQAASPAVPQAGALMGPAPAVAGGPAGDKQVCKYEVETGSNFRKKTCHTADEWAHIAADSRASVEKMQQNNGFTH